MNPVPTAEKSVEKMESDRLGKAWVSGGRILSKNAPDHYPLVAPCAGLALWKNGQLVEQAEIIDERDVLAVQPQDETREPEWSIAFSEDRMAACLTIKPGVRIRRALADQAPAFDLKLRLTETREPVLVDVLSVIEQLRQSGVIAGVDMVAIIRACRNEQPGTYTIACGVEPVRGRHGAFVARKEWTSRRELKERRDGTVDYREIREFPSARQGQVIGVVEPPVPGTPGFNVFGETVHAPEVYPVRIAEGHGIIVAGGHTVVAAAAGQPEIRTRGNTVHIRVAPELTIRQDIDLGHGNVHYIGAVHVLGSVQDGMLAEARGSVRVRDNVNMAKVVAGDSAVIGNNVIGSEVVVGGSGVLEQELRRTAGELSAQLSAMLRAMRQIVRMPAYRSAARSKPAFRQVLRALCEDKFKSVPALVVSLGSKARQGAEQLDPEWIALCAKLNRNFVLTSMSDIGQLDDVYALLAMLERMYAAALVHDEPDTACLQAVYVQNSRLCCSGDIQITGEGVYNSRLVAKGFIEIHGVVRGGEIHAQEGVRIREVGTKGGYAAKIQVPGGKPVVIHRAHAGTIIQIGAKIHTLVEEASFITEPDHGSFANNEKSRRVV